MRSLSDIAFAIFKAKDEKRQFEAELIKHRFQDQNSDYTHARAPRSDKHGGYISVDSQVVAQTQQCIHCNAHWVVRPGSGEVRGFCRNCMGPTCGHPACNASGPMGCIPWLKRLEMIEKRERGR